MPDFSTSANFPFFRRVYPLNCKYMDKSWGYSVEFRKLTSRELLYQ